MGTKKSRILHWFQIQRQNWKNLHDKNVISKKYAFCFLLDNYFTISSSDLELSWNSAFFDTYIDLYEEKKSFLLYFVRNMNCVSALYSTFLWFCIGWKGKRWRYFSSKMPRTMSNLQDFPHHLSKMHVESKNEILH